MSQIRIVNMLTKDENTVEVCAEDTVNQISNKYLVYNKHAGSYTWKRLPMNGEKVRSHVHNISTLEPSYSCTAGRGCR